MTLFNRFFALVALGAVAMLAPAQTSISTTTLSAAASNSDLYVQVASATGISIASPGTILFVDREALLVTSVSGTFIGVQRGWSGTAAMAHASSATVYLGPPSYFSSAPDPSGACTSSAQQVTPRINLLSGNIYVCNGSTWGHYGGYYFVHPANCGSKVGTTAYASGSPIVATAAANNAVYSVTTNTTAGTVEITCGITPPSRLLTGRGAALLDVTLLYGVQTTALSSIATATVSSVTYPTSTAAGATALGTVAAAGGTLTVTPTSLQTATTTSGLCYAEKATFASPIAVTTDNTAYSVDQIFTTAGTSATTIQVCGVIVHYTSVPQ